MFFEPWNAFVSRSWGSHFAKYGALHVAIPPPTSNVEKARNDQKLCSPAVPDRAGRSHWDLTGSDRRDMAGRPPGVRKWRENVGKIRPPFFFWVVYTHFNAFRAAIQKMNFFFAPGHLGGHFRLGPCRFSDLAIFRGRQIREITKSAFLGDFGGRKMHFWSSEKNVLQIGPYRHCWCS